MEELVLGNTPVFTTEYDYPAATALIGDEGSCFFVLIQLIVSRLIKLSCRAWVLVSGRGSC